MRLLAALVLLGCSRPIPMARWRRTNSCAQYVEDGWTVCLRVPSAPFAELHEITFHFDGELLLAKTTEKPLKKQQNCHELSG